MQKILSFYLFIFISSLRFIKPNYNTFFYSGKIRKHCLLLKNRLSKKYYSYFLENLC